MLWLSKALAIYSLMWYKSSVALSKRQPRQRYVPVSKAPADLSESWGRLAFRRVLLDQDVKPRIVSLGNVNGSFRWKLGRTWSVKRFQPHTLR